MEILRNKPNLFIVGAAKAGTSAVYGYLDIHPDIFMSPIKEPNFFSTDISVDNFRKDFKNDMKSIKIKDETNNFREIHEAYIRDIDVYNELFNTKNNYKYFGEASVSYLYSTMAPRNIFEYNKDAKIIIILRNPIERAFSHYLMDVQTGRNYSGNFKESLLIDYNQKIKGWGISNLYVELGLYYEQIKRYFDVFPREQILILSYSDFRDNNEFVLASIWRFLKVSPIQYPHTIEKNVARYPKNIITKTIINSSHLKVFKKYIAASLRRRLQTLLLTSNKKKKPQLNKEDKIDLQSIFEYDMLNLNEFLKEYDIEILL